MIPAYERDGIRLYVGDCREIVPQLGIQFSAVCTDPPYGLGFMGKDWDHEVPGEAFWRVFSDAMLPGAHLLSFGGTRTYHRIAVAIEDAGFEIRDTLMWLYGSGFPKSLDVSKAIDKNRRRDYVLAAIDLGLNIPGNSLHDWTMAEHSPSDAWWEKFKAHLSEDDWQRIERRVVGKRDDKGRTQTFGGGETRESLVTAPATPEAEQWQGWGTALKPSFEPVIMARKPLAGTVAQNVLTHGTGALNIDACRIGTTKDVPASPTGSRHVYAGGWRDQSGDRDVTDSSGWNPNIGRWPPNVILDPAAAAALDQMSGPTSTTGNRRIKDRVQQELGATPFTRGRNAPEYTDAGGPSRYFSVLPIDDPDTLRFLYCAKASRRERNRGLPEGVVCSHPTVKPLALMRWLLTLVTPPGGIVVDPFVGSGSTLVACAQLGIPAYGIDMNEEYIEIAARRIDHALNERAREEAKPRQLSIAD